LKRKGILVLALAAAATLVFAVASALAARSYSTHIVFLGNSGPPPNSLADQTFYGDLNSNPKCRGARVVGLFKQTSSGFKLLDVDLSSYNGAWALRADVSGQPNLAIQVKREKRNKGRIVCKPATLNLSPSSSSASYRPVP
jgi:hypothetical protein